MTPHRIKIMEAVGLALALGSSAWQIFVANWFQEQRDENRFIGLAEQNMANFMLLSDIQDSSKQADHSQYFLQARDWVSNAEIPGGGVVDAVTVSLFLLGSALIVAAKFFEANAARE